jgi:ribosomal protein S12 methylthiotransferase accessory factor YcaO
MLRTGAAKLFVPDGAPRQSPHDDAPPHPMSRMLAALMANDIEMYALDLTREDCPIAVAKVIAPRLQPFPSAVPAERLLQAARDQEKPMNPLRLL